MTRSFVMRAIRSDGVGFPITNVAVYAPTAMAPPVPLKHHRLRGFHRLHQPLRDFETRLGTRFAQRCKPLREMIHQPDTVARISSPQPHDVAHAQLDDRADHRHPAGPAKQLDGTAAHVERHPAIVHPPSNDRLGLGT